MTLEDVGLCLANFGVLALVFTPLERSFPARPPEVSPTSGREMKGEPRAMRALRLAARRWLRPEWSIDACFFVGQYIVWSGLALAALRVARSLVHAHMPLDLRSSFAALPLVAQVIVAVASGDLLVYWFHRACHRFDVLWRFHAVHHSAEHLDWLAAHREHPLDGLFTQLCQNVPALVVGLPMEVIAPLVIFRNAWAIFIHSNVRVPLGPLGVLFGDPALHHWHHARVARTAHNFANLAPWLDVLFGTFYRPQERASSRESASEAPEVLGGQEVYPLGLPDPWPRGYLAQLVRPFVPEGALSALAPSPSKATLAK